MLIVTGTIAYDYIMDFPGKFSDHILPDKIHTLNVSFTVDTFDKRRGGTAGNVSYTLALLHTPHILFSVAGKDFAEYKKHFEKIGIDTNHVLIDSSRNSATGFAITDKADNQIWGFFYGAAELTKELRLDRIVSRNDFVLIGPSGKDGSLSLIEQCIDKEISYMFDPGFLLTELTNEQLAFGVGHASHIIGNDYEITVMRKRLKSWKDLVASKTVITTLGEKGAMIETPRGTHRIQVAQPSAVADPTGAGDAFRAGFLAGWERNFNVQTCGQIASVAASFAIEKYGAQEHSFTLDRFKRRYRQTYSNTIPL